MGSSGGMSGFEDAERALPLAGSPSPLTPIRVSSSKRSAQDVDANPSPMSRHHQDLQLTPLSQHLPLNNSQRPRTSQKRPRRLGTALRKEELRVMRPLSV